MAIEVTKTRLCAFAAITLLSTNTFADGVTLPATPGVSLSGYAGNGWTALSDIMLPMIGKPLNFTYLDPQIEYHSDQSEYTGSLGVGQRWLTENNIWGAYLFGDYNHSAANQGFWFVSPGIERLGRTWDFSANGYIPVSRDKLNTGTEFADEAGDFSQIHFSGHDQYDALVNTFESTGWGADAQIGLHLQPLRNMKLMVGSYYFNLQDSDPIIGGAVRAEIPLNSYLSAAISEAYDREMHHTLKIGLSLSLGGRHSATDVTDDLSQRLVDPLQRNLIAVSGGSHTGMPIVATVADSNQVALEVSNIAFFVADNTTASGSSDGTYENPYSSFSQDNINDANQHNNRNFYLNSGVYHPEYSANNNQIILNNDQVYGRQDNFLEAAQGNQRPLLNFSQNGLTTTVGDSTDGISGLQLSGTGNGDGIFINHQDDTPLDVTIANVSSRDFGLGIHLATNASAPTLVHIENASLTNNLSDGILAQNQGSGGLNLSVNNSLIQNNGGSGVYLVNYLLGNVTVHIDHSQVNQNANNGIYAINEFNSGALNLTVSHSTIADNADNGIQLYNGVGSYNTNTGDLVSHIYDTVISGNGQNGVIASNTSSGLLTLDIDHTTVTDNLDNGVEAVNTGATGSFIFNLGHSTINSNGLNGLEIFNEENTGNFNLSIAASSLSANNDDGIFVVNSESNGNITADISSSQVNNNGMDGVYALNDLSKGAMTLTITNSAFNDNTKTGIVLDNHSQSSTLNTCIADSQINDNGINGIGALNESESGSLSLTVSGSAITGNQFNGVGLSTTANSGDLTAQITDSKITDNQYNGVIANNQVTATINTSIISGNGVSVMNGGMININNPVYFNGGIKNNNGKIQFNGVDAPDGANYAQCILGICHYSYAQ